MLLLDIINSLLAAQLTSERQEYPSRHDPCGASDQPKLPCPVKAHDGINTILSLHCAAFSRASLAFSRSRSVNITIYDTRPSRQYLFRFPCISSRTSHVCAPCFFNAFCCISFLSCLIPFHQHHDQASCFAFSVRSPVPIGRARLCWGANVQSEPVAHQPPASCHHKQIF